MGRAIAVALLHTAAEQQLPSLCSGDPTRWLINTRAHGLLQLMDNGHPHVGRDIAVALLLPLLNGSCRRRTADLSIAERHVFMNFRFTC